MSHCLESVAFELRNDDQSFSMEVGELIGFIHDSLLSSLYLEGDVINMNESESKRLISSFENSYFGIS